MTIKFEEKVVERLTKRIYEFGENYNLSVMQIKTIYRLIKSCEAEQTLEDIFDEAGI